MSIIERKVTTYRAECDDCGWTGYRAFRKSMAEGDLTRHVCGLHREAHMVLAATAASWAATGTPAFAERVGLSTNSFLGSAREPMADQFARYHAQLTKPSILRWLHWRRHARVGSVGSGSH